ncbi:DUF2059 domain-containing protein [Dyella sp. A6]|uniref:DUF2059 domain-containing protein n=1 Tax=Dyella aluminiiresistens TaxID=3069105 RepID=UPI002E78695A|nr:DUF2059 domain-containing protein [Dyella sp. A6]
MRKWAVAMSAGLLLTCGMGQAAMAAQPSAEQVRQLMQVFNVGKMFSQMNAQMAGVMGQQLPCVPASYWQNFIDAQGVKQLTDRMIPVYQKQFTAKDVAGLLKFYHSPLGQKVIAVMPETMAEGMQIGRQWGRERALQMMGELQKEGKVNAQGRCPASPSAGASSLKGN